MDRCGIVGYFKPHWKASAKAEEIIGYDRSNILFVANHASRVACISDVVKYCGMLRPANHRPIAECLLVAHWEI
jgi:hypothetical protein